MLNLKVIGAGAAGNKAAISLIGKGFNKNNVTLINSTSRDIPDNFRDSAIIFGSNSDTLGGCGKERDIGKTMFLRDLRTGSINIDSIIDPTTQAVVIASSTEGGTGSAITPILAKYIKEIFGIPVIICLFFGFNSDVRGMQNSIEICQELSDNYGVIGISNMKFLESCNNNKLKAEQCANDLFVDIVTILTGDKIKPGSQNIDMTDLYKLVTTSGYMSIGSANISKIKNLDQYSKSITSAIDDTKLVDISKKGAKRIGIIVDASESIYDYIDFSATDISNAFGLPYEVYTHVQNTSDDNNVIWIAAGLPMPIDEIKAIYDNYLKNTDLVNKQRDEFFSTVSEFRGKEVDGMFNMLGSSNSASVDRNDFFKNFGLEDKKPVKKSSSSEY